MRRLRPGGRAAPAAGSALLLTGILLLAGNLRPAAVSVGPVLTEVRAGLDLSAAEAGLLTSLPVLAFALFGALAPGAAARLGLHRAILLALLVVSTGLVARSLLGSEAPFLVVSLLALGGMAMANVLMPSLVRRHFPDRVGRVTALYTTVLSVGLTASLGLTVPIADAAGTWRAGLGAWAVPAVAAALVWAVVLRLRPDRPERAENEDGEPEDGDSRAGRGVTMGFRDVARTRLGWAMVVFFGMQSMLAYGIFGWFSTLWRDAGFSASTAGLLLATVALSSVPMSYVVPRLMAAGRGQLGVLVAICSCYPVGFLGLLTAPRELAVLWAVLVGVATSTFPVVLVMIGLRSRTPEGTAALSGFTQSLGYLFAAVGPFGVGLIHDASGGWTVPLLVMAAVVVPLLGAGAVVLRLPPLEDELGVDVVDGVLGSRP